MANESIGTRAYGKWSAHERWYECSVCGQVKRMSETVVPSAPHPQAGKRVCTTGAKCYDEIDYNTRQQISPPQPSATEDRP